MSTVLLPLSQEEAQVRTLYPLLPHARNVCGRQASWKNAYNFVQSLGIGKMMATTLAENGAHKVFIIGRREEPLKELAAKFPGYV